jgi:hypothetical protein
MFPESQLLWPSNECCAVTQSESMVLPVWHTAKIYDRLLDSTVWKASAVEYYSINRLPTKVYDQKLPSIAKNFFRALVIDFNENSEETPF